MIWFVFLSCLLFGMRYAVLGATGSWVELGLGFGWRPLWERSLINSPWGQESSVQYPGLSASTLEAQAKLPVRESIPHKPFIMVIKGIKKKPRQMLKQNLKKQKSKGNISMCMHVCAHTHTHTYTHTHTHTQETKTKPREQSKRQQPDKQRKPKMKSTN